MEGNSKSSSPLHLAAVSFLWSQPYSNLVQLGFLFVSHVQYIFCLLYIQFGVIVTTKSDSIVFWLLEASQNLLVKDPGAQKDSSTTFVLFNLGITIYILCLWFTIISTITRSLLKLSKYRFASFTTFFLSQFHLSIGFWVVNMYLLSNLFDSSTKTYASSTYNQSFLSQIALMFVVVSNYLLGLIMSILSYDPFCSDNILSAHTSVHQVLLFSSKGLILPLIAFSRTDSTGLCYVVVCCLIMTFGRVWYMMRNFPYYHSLPMKSSLVFDATATVISVCNIGFLLIKNNSASSMSLFYIEIMLIAFVLWICSTSMNKLVQEAFSTKDDDLKSEREVFIKIFALRQILSQTKIYLDTKFSDFHELQLRGILASYLRNPEVEKILTKKMNQEKSQRRDYIDTAVYSEVINIIITCLLRTSANKPEYSNKLKVILAQHLIVQQRNFSSGLPVLFETASSQGLHKLAILKQLERIQNDVQQQHKFSKNAVFNLKIFIDHARITSKFSQMIYTTSKKVLQFWKVHSEPKVQIMKLYSISQEVEQTDQQIRTYWSKHIEFHTSLVSSFVTLYTCYLHFVRNASHSAYKMAVRYKHLICTSRTSKHCSLKGFQMASSDVVLLNLLITKNIPSRILDISSSITDHLGWTRKDVLNQSIRMILCPAMLSMKTQSLLKFLDGDFDHLVIDQEVNILLYSKEGYLVPALLYITIHPYVQEAPTLIGVLKFKKIEEQLIVLSEYGSVEGITREIAAQLNIPPHGRISVKQFCHNFEALNFMESSRLHQTGNMREFNCKELIRGKSDNQSTHNSDQELTLDLFQFMTNDQKKSGTIQASTYTKRVTLIHPLNSSFSIIVFNKSFTRYDNDNSFLTELERTCNINEMDEGNGYHAKNKRIEKTHIITAPRSINRDAIPKIEVFLIDNDTSTLQIEAGHDLDIIVTPTTPKTYIINPPLSPTESNQRLIRPSQMYGFSPRLTTSEQMLEVQTSTLDERFKFMVNSSTSKCLPQRTAEDLVKVQQGSSYHTASAYSTDALESKIESAIYAVSPKSNNRFLSVLMPIFSIICGVFLIVFEIQNIHVKRALVQNTLITSNISRLLGHLIEVNDLTLRSTLLDQGIFQDNQYSFIGNSSIIRDTPVQLKKEITILRSINNGVRNAIYNTEQDSCYKFFTAIPVYVRDSASIKTVNRHCSIFELADEIVARLDQLYTTSFSGRLSDNYADIAFILDNDLNELLLFGESIADLVSKDSSQKLQQTTRLLVVFTILVGVLGMTMMHLLLMVVKRYIKDRNKLLTVILSIDEKDVFAYTSYINNICNSLEENGMDGRQFNTAALTYNQDKQVDIPHISSHKRKVANRLGINYFINSIVTFAGLLTLFLFASFIITSSLINHENNKFKTTVDFSIKCDMIQYRAHLLMYETWIYIESDQRSNVRGHSLKDDWNDSYNYIKNILEDSIKMMEDSDPAVLSILTGNLCTLLQTIEAEKMSYCPIGLYGVAEKGLIQLSNTILSTLSTIKEEFDSTNQTKQDKITLLTNKDLLEAEVISSNYWTSGFAAISNILRAKLTHKNTSFHDLKSSIALAWGVIYIIFGSSGWLLIHFMFTKHQRRWKKMMRLVPMSVIDNNKIYVNYLFRNANSLNLSTARQRSIGNHAKVLKILE